jgi:hypothetical protein
VNIDSNLGKVKKMKITARSRKHLYIIIKCPIKKCNFHLYWKLIKSRVDQETLDTAKATLKGQLLIHLDMEHTWDELRDHVMKRIKLIKTTKITDIQKLDGKQTIRKITAA